MNRHKRIELFARLYLSEIQKAPFEKRYNCYLCAESAIKKKTGGNQYSSYASFRASMSRREKMKRLALKNKSLINETGKSV